MPEGVRRLFFEFLYLTSIIRSLINKYIKYGRDYLFWNKEEEIVSLIKNNQFLAKQFKMQQN